MALRTNNKGRNTRTFHLIPVFMCFVFPVSIRHLTASPGWILQSLEPQFAFRVERNHHLVLAQDLQTEGEMPHTNLVTPRRPGEGDGVLRLSLHSHPATWWQKWIINDFSNKHGSHSCATKHRQRAADADLTVLPLVPPQAHLELDSVL